MNESDSAPFILLGVILAFAFFLLLLSTRPWRRRARKLSQKAVQYCAMFLIATTTIATIIVAAYIWSGNVHTVIAGELYRSGQLTPQKLKSLQRVYGLRTIVNLRGENGQSGWYQDEIALTRATGLDHIDFKISAKRELSEVEITRLVELLRRALKPILIHCESGADRSGLASALYLLAVAGLDEDAAERQLSPLFGHIGIPFVSPFFAMDRTWERIESMYRSAKQ